jgi:hypothetical protein
MGRELMKGSIGAREKSLLLLPLQGKKKKFSVCLSDSLLYRCVKMFNVHACTEMQADGSSQLHSWDAETEFRYV